MALGAVVAPSVAEAIAGRWLVTVGTIGSGVISICPSENCDTGASGVAGVAMAVGPAGDGLLMVMEAQGVVAAWSWPGGEGRRRRS